MNWFVHFLFLDINQFVSEYFFRKQNKKEVRYQNWKCLVIQLFTLKFPWSHVNLVCVCVFVCFMCSIVIKFSRPSSIWKTILRRDITTQSRQKGFAWPSIVQYWNVTCIVTISRDHLAIISLCRSASIGVKR